MKKANLLISIATLFGAALSPVSAQAENIPPVSITAWGMHRGGAVVYKYQIKNAGTNPIKTFTIGFNPADTSADGGAELATMPNSKNKSFWLSPDVATSPTGWGVAFKFPDESPKFLLQWSEGNYEAKLRPGASQVQGAPVVANPANDIPPGASWDGFSVNLEKADFSYVSGHALVLYGDDTLSIPIKKGDTTPPKLAVAIGQISKTDAASSVLNINVTTSDSYDPSPEIVLVSVTANQALNPSDVIAAIGKDTRQITVSNAPGRIYEIKYAAIDASGNKATQIVSYQIK